MRIVIAMDSFKGSLSSIDAGEAVRDGIFRVIPDAQVYVRPLADGGEGTLQTLTAGMGGRMENVRVTGPVGKPVDCMYGMIKEKKTAVIEMAGAAGITLVPVKERNPVYTTTYGVGEVMMDAFRKGCRHFIIGIGGSATNDGGIGMLQALGFGMLDREGKQVEFGARGLEKLAAITTDHVPASLWECTFQVAGDVTNPLCGENGCSVVFGPQKGADAEMIRAMDRWMERYADLAAGQFMNADKHLPGTGAAGGLGFALRTFLNADLRKGVELVLEETDLESYVKEADIVITGEGCLDGQTAMGKAPAGVAALAKKHGKVVLAFTGCVGKDAGQCHAKGIDAYFPILRKAESLTDAMDPACAQRNLADSAEQVFRLIVMFYKNGN